MKNQTIENFITFYAKAEKLKSTLRHSWLASSHRQESTAEHSWMLGLLAIVLFDELKLKVNVFRVLKMVLIHDLAEAVTGDIPSFEVSSRQEKKHEAEKDALEYLIESLPKKTGREIIDLWEEFEKKQTPEAQFANSLDKIEVLLQHNLADISSWDQGDFNVHPYYRDSFFDFDSFMRTFKDHVDTQSMKKIIKAKKESLIDPKHLERYKLKKI